VIISLHIFQPEFCMYFSSLPCLTHLTILDFMTALNPTDILILVPINMYDVRVSFAIIQVRNDRHVLDKEGLTFAHNSR